MKKIVILTTLWSLLLISVGCTAPSETVIESEPIIETEENTPTPIPTVIEINETTFDDLEMYASLDTKNYATQMDEEKQTILNIYSEIIPVFADDVAVEINYHELTPDLKNVQFAYSVSNEITQKQLASWYDQLLNQNRIEILGSEDVLDSLIGRYEYNETEEIPYDKISFSYEGKIFNSIFSQNNDDTKFVSLRFELTKREYEALKKEHDLLAEQGITKEEFELKSKPQIANTTEKDSEYLEKFADVLEKATEFLVSDNISSTPLEHVTPFVIGNPKEILYMSFSDTEMANYSQANSLDNITEKTVFNAIMAGYEFKYEFIDTSATIQPIRLLHFVNPETNENCYVALDYDMINSVSSIYIFYTGM